MDARASRREWIEAALGLLEAEGAEAIRVPTLAEELGVAPAGFRDLFASLAELLEAVLDRWEERETAEVLAAVESRGGTPARRLARLVDALAERPLSLEWHVRAWAARAPAVGRRVRAVDARRLGWIEARLLEGGGAAEAAVALYALALGRRMIAAEERERPAAAAARILAALGVR